MQRFKNTKDFDEYVKNKPLSPRILKEISAAVGQVQDLINSGFQGMKACVILIETEKEHETVIRKYGLSDIVPEFTEEIIDGKNTWQKSVYITDDSGDGIVVFYKPDVCP